MNKRHGHRCNGKISATYASHRDMKQRCNNSKNKRYSNYGGRNISYCKAWDNFVNFLNDMGESPEGKTLDRIDNDGNYGPDNCKWSTPKEQCANRGGKFKCVE